MLEQPAATKTGIRDRFIIRFLFATGVRLDEFRHIKLKDIVTEEKYPYVMVTGKGSKKRIIPVSDETFMENYSYYCTLYHQNKNMEDYLFFTVNRDGRGMMSEDNVQRILKKYADMARKTDSSFPNVHPHLMRHSYGAQMYRLGLSLAEIAKLLGHENITTTEIYAETDLAMATEALKKMIGNQLAREWDNLSEEDKVKFLGSK